MHSKIYFTFIVLLSCFCISTYFIVFCHFYCMLSYFIAFLWNLNVLLKKNVIVQVSLTIIYHFGREFLIVLLGGCDNLANGGLVWQCQQWTCRISLFCWFSWLQKYILWSKSTVSVSRKEQTSQSNKITMIVTCHQIGGYTCGMPPITQLPLWLVCGI